MFLKGNTVYESVKVQIGSDKKRGKNAPPPSKTVLNR